MLHTTYTSQKMRFFTKNFFSKHDQIHRASYSKGIPSAHARWTQLLKLGDLRRV